jgi:hypothetical protein
MKIHIVDGNSKMGKTPNISTLPDFDCGLDVPCKRDCYAQKFLFRPSVRKAWTENSTMQRCHVDEYFREISVYLEKKKPEWFRIHVAGDFIDQHTLTEWKILAGCYPETKFLAFTKRFDLDFRGLPGNVTIRASLWPRWGNPARLRRGGLPLFWMQDGTEDRIPRGGIVCPGSCETCRACWDRRITDIVVEKH